MLAVVVAVEQSLRHPGAVRLQGEGVVGHFGYAFEDDRVVSGFKGAAAPDKRGVAIDEAGGDGEGIDFVLTKVVDDGTAGLMDVAAGDGLVIERCGAWDRAVEVVGVGGAERGDGEAGLGEAGGELRVGVDDGADGEELAVEQGVGVEVGGGPELAVDDLAVEVGDDHEFGDQLIIFDPRGLDDDQALVAVDAAGVAEGVEDEAALDDFEVGFEDLGTKFLEEHGFSG